MSDVFGWGWGDRHRRTMERLAHELAGLSHRIGILDRRIEHLIAVVTEDPEAIAEITSDLARQRERLQAAIDAATPADPHLPGGDPEKK